MHIDVHKSNFFILIEFVEHFFLVNWNLTRFSIFETMKKFGK